MQDRASHISLIIGLAIPVVMVVFIAAAILLPGQSLHPTTDFIYATGSYPNYTTRNDTTVTQHNLVVQNGVLTDNTQNYKATENYPPYPFEKESIPRLFLYDVQNNTNTELTVKEVEKLKLSSEAKSPDGLTVSFGKKSYGVFPFFFSGESSDMEHAYISNRTASKEINLVSDASRNIYSFQLVGWVIAQE